MRNLEKNKIQIACCVLAVALFLASLISICVYNTYSKGVPQSDATIYIDGVEFNRTLEVQSACSYEVKVDAKDGVDYYLHIDAVYGAVKDNNTIKINGGLSSLTRIPLRVILIKDNYAVREYVYYLTVGPI
ncbi:MAG: hypothetical protein K2O95_05565 [Clostridia bacterium]|nr:hypothetical protein [Clostridia bacterium]